MAPLQQLPIGITVRIKAPATSANLGPGFDSMGLALGLYDEVEISTIASGFQVQVSGESEDRIPRDSRHMIITIMRTQLARVGWDVPGVKLTAINRIPHGRGLGSSAAAHVTAVLAANAMLEQAQQRSVAELLNDAARLEGHPDNVAPALYGAVALSWEDHPDLQQRQSSYHSVKVTPHASITPVVAVPENALSTETARGLLPAEVSHHIAATNSSRAALLSYALSHDPQVLLPATEDHLHQRFRAMAMPESVGLMDELREKGYAAVISGAGPTVMVLARTPKEAERVNKAIKDYVADSAQGWSVRILPVDTEGAKVEVIREG